MSILYITNKPIYPIIDGGCYAMDSFLNSLLYCESKVKHLTIATQKHPFLLNQYPEKIQEKTRPEAVTLFTTFSGWKLIISLIRNLPLDSWIIPIPRYPSTRIRTVLLPLTMPNEILSATLTYTPFLFFCH